MSYASKRRGREEDAKRKGNVYLIIAALSAIVLGGLFAYNKSIQEGINEDGDLCLDSGPRGFWAIVLDTSDALSETQKLWVRKYFDEVVASRLPKFYQVALYSTTSAQFPNAVPQVRICNPGDGSDKNIWIANKQMVRRKFEEKFLGPVNSWLESELDGSAASESPLMRYISEATVTAFPIDKTNTELRLVVVSDMLENTAEYSHYRTEPDFENQKALPSHARLAPHLERVEVHIIYIKRQGAESIQKQYHVDFWREFFRFHGGRVTQVDPI